MARIPEYRFLERSYGPAATGLITGVQCHFYRAIRNLPGLKTRQKADGRREMGRPSIGRVSGRAPSAWEMGSVICGSVPEAAGVSQDGPPLGMARDVGVRDVVHAGRIF